MPEPAVEYGAVATIAVSWASKAVGGAESRVWALGVVIGAPVRDDGAGVVEPVKQRLIQELVSHL
ncbi:hypothetical protein SDC9_25578 [bioreactor metagenome]|uniref:Uncharacterized protein n=1 Tax=bioreactor metagenome TaxID=1076179 RepID=A0A644UL47_9ZZZZ